MLTFLATSYSLPGRVNGISRRTLMLFKSMLNRGSDSDAYYKRECKVKIKCCREIRINIGYANFYEKTTALNLLNFLTTQTISVCLMF